MIRFEPTMPRSISFQNPDCPECGAAMRLFGIEADEAGRELLSFDCLRCQHIETAMRKSNALHFLSSH